MKKIARLSALCLVLLVSIATGRNSYSGEAFSVPVSDQIIRGELVLPGGQAVKFGAREGSMVTVRDRDTGYFIGLAATIENESNGARFSFFNIEERVEGEEISQAVRFLSATAVAGPGSKHVVPTAFGNIILKFRKVVPGEFPGGELLDPQSTDPEELERAYGVTSAGTCCVGCGRLTVCGSEVAAECGSCSGGGFRVY